MTYRTIKTVLTSNVILVSDKVCQARHPGQVCHLMKYVRPGIWCTVKHPVMYFRPDFFGPNQTLGALHLLQSCHLVHNVRRHLMPSKRKPGIQVLPGIYKVQAWCWARLPIKTDISCRYGVQDAGWAITWYGQRIHAHSRKSL